MERKSSTLQTADWMVGSNASRMKFVPQNSTSTSPYYGMSPIVEDSDSSSCSPNEYSCHPGKKNNSRDSSYSSSDSDNNTKPTSKCKVNLEEYEDEQVSNFSTTNRIRRQNELPRLDTSPKILKMERPKRRGKRVAGNNNRISSRKSKIVDSEFRSFVSRKTSFTNSRETKKKPELIGRRGRIRSRKYIFSKEEERDGQHEDRTNRRKRRSNHERDDQSRRRKRKKREGHEGGDGRRKERGGNRHRHRRQHQEYRSKNQRISHERRKEGRKNPRKPYQQGKIDEKTIRCMSPTRSKMISSNGRKIISRFDLSAHFTPLTPGSAHTTPLGSPRSPNRSPYSHRIGKRIPNRDGEGEDENGLYQNSLNQESYFTEMKKRIITKHREQTEQEQYPNRVNSSNCNKNSGFFNYQNYLNSQNVNLEVRKFAIESNEDFSNFLHRRRNNNENDEEEEAQEKYILSKSNINGQHDDCESVYSLNTWVPATPKVKKKKKKKKRKEGVLTKLFRSGKKSKNMEKRRRQLENENNNDMSLYSPNRNNRHHQVFTTPDSSTSKKRTRFRFPNFSNALFGGSRNGNNNVTTCAANSTYPNLSNNNNNNSKNNLMELDRSNISKKTRLRPITTSNGVEMRKQRYRQQKLRNGGYNNNNMSKKNLQETVLPLIRKIF